MRRRWSVAGQLLALQLGIIAVVLVGVGGVSLAQAQIDFRRTEGARALSAAENLAARPVLRQALVGAVAARAHRPVRADRRRRAEPVGRVVRGDRRRRRRGRRQHPRPRPARHAVSRHWRTPAVVGGRRRGARAGRAVVAHVPVFGETGPQTGRVVGAVAVGQKYPSLGESLLSAVPNLLTYLGLAGIVGVAGSLLVARRVKRQTLGLEPVEIRGLVEHREAMLTGIKEGVLGLDLDERVTLVNAEAHRMLGLPADCVGRTLHRARRRGPAARRAHRQRRRSRTPWCSSASGSSRSTASRSRCAARPVGSVTTMRDLTELRAAGAGAGRHPADDRGAAGAGARVRQPAAHDLRACSSSRSTTRCCATSSGSARRPRNSRPTVTERIDEPAARRAAHRQVQRGRRARDPAAPGRRETRVGPLDEELAEDLATVVGNLVDNALDAVGPARRRRGRRCAVRGGRRRRGGRGPRLGPRGGARAGRGGLHQRLHDQGRRGRATAASGWR